jgi:hypothetical protein
MDFFGVGRLSSASLDCCGDAPERDERDALLVRRGEEVDWRRAKEDEGLRAEVGVGGAFGEVGDGNAAALARRSFERDMRFMVLLMLSWGSVLFVACEATEGERVDAGDFGGRSMLVVPRSKRGCFQGELFSQSVCAWWLTGRRCLLPLSRLTVTCVASSNARTTCRRGTGFNISRLSISPPASSPPSQSNDRRDDSKQVIETIAKTRNKRRAAT